MRVEISNKKEYRDGRALKLEKLLKKHYGITTGKILIIDSYVIDELEGLTSPALKEIFCDPVAQNIAIDKYLAEETETQWSYLISVSYKRGVTDPVALTARDAILLFLKDTEDNAFKNPEVKFSTEYIFSSPLDKTEIKKVLGYLYNPLIQDATVISKDEWEKGKRPGVEKRNRKLMRSREVVEHFDLSVMDDDDLDSLSRKRLLALSIKEMRAVKYQYEKSEFIEKRRLKGLSGRITDVELEMIAQTWSEHCKHKIFNATIRYTDGEAKEEIESLFRTYIKGLTEKLWEKKDYLKSVFHDNSGVIRFDNEHLVCFKVETHNSPSALDPYGGAITGIVGVNRDIIGTGKGARPIFNTDVLCFADPKTPPEDVPKGLLHPRRLMDGVHSGIIDGGNQSGIPVAAGGFLFDESFMGKPLVFCGTGGILPAKINNEDAWIKHIDPGDLAVMAGGRIGKDGIHGATFSSLSLSEASPTSAVQIGDPITQKKLLDFLMEARDLGLYKGITDNGAGGLSSSLGEMAQYSGGVKIDLSACPLKYPGLLPWEILVSESQERMSLSVSRDKIQEFLALAKKRDVEATVVGVFTDTGMVEVTYEGQTVGYIDLDFLHNGLPVMQLEAKWPKIKATSNSTDFTNNPTKREPSNSIIKQIILSLLENPNIASKENLVRQYDHEVQGLSVIKPFVGKNADSPSDGAVLKPVYNSYRGLTITHGICPWYSEYDTYNMAMCAVDEAMRAHIALGGEPKTVAALDNFCWPDPVESEANPEGTFRLAQLVRACKGLYQACLEYEIPLISGKDSMKNNTDIGGKKLSVKPTLLISLIGIVPDIRKSMTTDFKKSGDIIVLLGQTKRDLLGSFYHRLISTDSSLQTELSGKDRVKGWSLPLPNLKRAKSLYAKLYMAIEQELVASCHDLSEGGFAVAISESALGGRLGAEIKLGKTNLSTEEFLFSESPSRFLVTVSPENIESFISRFESDEYKILGRVTGEKLITFSREENRLFTLTLDEIEKHWKREI